MVPLVMIMSSLQTTALRGGHCGLPLVHSFICKKLVDNRFTHMPLCYWRLGYHVGVQWPGRYRYHGLAVEGSGELIRAAFSSS